MVFQERFQIATRGRGTYLITQEVNEKIRCSGVATGLCHVFLHHTSASLILCENADPDVRSDLERYMKRLVPDGDPQFAHTAEGPDDMPAHIRTILTSNDLTIPVNRHRCELGTWQGLYLWEHRSSAFQRQLTVTVYGD